MTLTRNQVVSVLIIAVVFITGSKFLNAQEIAQEDSPEHAQQLEEQTIASFENRLNRIIQENTSLKERVKQLEASSRLSQDTACEDLKITIQRLAEEKKALMQTAEAKDQENTRLAQELSGHKKAKTTDTQRKETIAALKEQNQELQKKLSEQENNKRKDAAWPEKVKSLQEEKTILSQKLEEKVKETEGLKQQLTVCKQEAESKESQKAVLEAMVEKQAKPLLKPSLVKAEEKELEKIIHTNLGFAYGLKGKTDEAIAEYKKALSFAPSDRDINFNLGVLLSKQKKYQEAITSYKQALQGSPQDKEVYYNLAIIYLLGLKDTALSQKYYQEFLSLDQGH